MFSIVSSAAALAFNFTEDTDSWYISVSRLLIIFVRYSRRSCAGVKEWVSGREGKLPREEVLALLSVLSLTDVIVALWGC